MIVFDDDENEDVERDDEDDEEEDGDEGESSFSVRVLSSDQEPWPNVPVALGFHGVTRGVTDDEFTDDDGVATFDGFRDGDATVYVRGEDCESYYFEDGTEITVTV